MWPRLAALVLLVPLLLSSGCATTAPSDTALPARERTVTDQVLAFDSSKEAGGDPGCGSRKVVNTEVARPFEPGSQGAAGYWSERWTVDRCGRPIPYLVNFIRAPDGHLGVTIFREEGSERAVIPGSTIADRLLQRDTFLLLVQRDLSELEGGACRTRKVTDTEVVIPVDGAQVEGGRPVAGQWAERWTLDRCGARVRYIVRFVTTRTGTTFTAEREKPLAAPQSIPAAPTATPSPSETRPSPPAAAPQPAAGVGARPATSSPAPVEHGPEPRAPQAPPTAAPERPTGPSKSEDPGAVIDWLLKPPRDK